jgi:hypothetical protein
MISIKITITQTALSAHARRIHNSDGTSSLPQSIDGVNVSNLDFSCPAGVACGARRDEPCARTYRR